MTPLNLLMMFCFLLLQLIEIFQSRTIEIPFSFSLTSAQIQMQIGSTKKNIIKRIDQELGASLFFNDYYSIGVSKTEEMHGKAGFSFKKNPKIYFFNLYSDSLYFKDNLTLQKFCFYFSNEESVRDIQKDGLAFSLSIGHRNSSLTHLLYFNELIDKKMYTILNNKNDLNRGTIIFGEVPQIEERGLGVQCHISTNRYNWECPLDSAFFYNNTGYNGDNSYHGLKKKANVIFNAGEEYIYAPLSFITLLNETFFKSKIERGSCVYNYLFSKKTKHSFVCDCLIEDDFFSELFFEIHGKNFKILKKDLFIWVSFDENSPCLFTITENEGSEDWIFGGPFFRDNIGTFDYDSRSVTLYSISEPILKKKKSPTIFLIQLNFLLLSLSLFFLIFIRKKRLSILK